MDFQDKIINTFNKRSTTYENKTDWVKQNECVMPLTPEVFGDGLAIDVCAGTGAISKALINIGWKVLPMDISKLMLEQNSLPFSIIGDIHSIPTLDKHFDLVVCRQGLQYSNLEIAITEMARICKTKIILGHITKELEDDYNFWNEYFKIASPGRKHIFLPGEIEKTVSKLGLKIEKCHTIHQQDNYLGPILHLTSDEQQSLVDLLNKTPEKFKQIYNVSYNNDEITYSNRWEFIEISV